MPMLMAPPPYSQVEAVTEILHGVPISDPYRWLEDQDSPRTRGWLAAQMRYTRSHLDSIPGRERIRERVRELLDLETYDSLQKTGNRYFFRKRLPGQEQPSIYMRNGADGEDQLLFDPAERGTGRFRAVKPLQVSPNGELLLYEIKEGGERTGTFALLDIENAKRFPMFFLEDTCVVLLLRRTARVSTSSTKHWTRTDRTFALRIITSWEPSPVMTVRSSLPVRTRRFA